MQEQPGCWTCPSPAWLPSVRGSLFLQPAVTQMPAPVRGEPCASAVFGPKAPGKGTWHPAPPAGALKPNTARSQGWRPPQRCSTNRACGQNPQVFPEVGEAQTASASRVIKGHRAPDAAPPRAWQGDPQTCRNQSLPPPSRSLSHLPNTCSDPRVQAQTPGCLVWSSHWGADCITVHWGKWVFP